MPLNDWLRTAIAHVERIEALLLVNYKLSRAQLDALWAYVGKVDNIKKSHGLHHAH